MKQQCIHICLGLLLSILLCIYLVLELLSHAVILFLAFQGTTKLFSAVLVPFYVPISNAGGCQLPHILTNTCNFLFFKNQQF